MNTKSFEEKFLSKTKEFILSQFVLFAKRHGETKENKINTHDPSASTSISAELVVLSRCSPIKPSEVLEYMEIGKSTSYITPKSWVLKEVFDKIMLIPEKYTVKINSFCSYYITLEFENGLKKEFRIDPVLEDSNPSNEDYLFLMNLVTNSIPLSAYKEITVCPDCGGTNTSIVEGFPGDSVEVCLDCVLKKEIILESQIT